MATSLAGQQSSSRPRHGEDKANQRQEEDQSQDNKLFNVTVTILSLDGIHVKETTSKSRFSRNKVDSNAHTRGRSPARSRSRSPWRGRSKSGGKGSKNKSAKIKPVEDVSTTMVASFERASVTKNSSPSKKVTHLASLPLSLPPASSPNGGSNGEEGTFSDVVSWPEGRKLSSFTFQRRFPCERVRTAASAAGAAAATTRRPRYVPQLCPIQISIRRPDGRLHKLGTASVHVNGEEDGRASANVPLITDVASKYWRSGGSSKNNRGKVSLMKLKGDPIRCGVAEGATLRVQVHVWDPVASTTETAMRRIGKAISFEGVRKEGEESASSACCCLEMFC